MNPPSKKRKWGKGKKKWKFAKNTNFYFFAI